MRLQIFTAAVDQVVLFRDSAPCSGCSGVFTVIKFICLGAGIFLRIISSTKPNQFIHPEDADNTLDYNLNTIKNT
jgi:hypothetical protein